MNTTSTISPLLVNSARTNLYRVQNSSSAIINSTTTVRQETEKVELTKDSGIADYAGVPFFLSSTFEYLMISVVVSLIIATIIFLWIQWRIRLLEQNEQVECELREISRCRRRQQQYDSFTYFPSLRRRQQMYGLTELQFRGLRPKIITMRLPTESMTGVKDFSTRNDKYDSPVGAGPVFQIPTSSQMRYWNAPGDIQVHCAIESSDSELGGSATNIDAPSLVKLEGQTLRRVARSLIRALNSTSGSTITPLPKKEIKERYRLRYVSRRTRCEQKRRLRLERNRIKGERLHPEKRCEKRKFKYNSRSMRIKRRRGFVCHQNYFERRQRRIQRQRMERWCHYYCT